MTQPPASPTTTTGPHRSGLCSRCGYPLEGLSPNTPCPECGQHDPIETSIPDGVRCVSCAYHLSGLPLHSRCPECGTSVLWSVRGPLLERRDPAFVARLARGASIATWSSLAAGLLFVLSLVVPFVTVMLVPSAPAGHRFVSILIGTVMNVLAMSGVVLFFYGWRLLAVRDPAVHPGTPGESVRRATRLAATIAAWIAGLGIVLAGAAGAASAGSSGTVSIPVQNLASLVITALLALSGLVVYATGMLHIRELALRIPSLRLRKAAEFRLWFIPVLGIGLTVLLSVVCLFFIGPVVAAVLYYLTIARLAEELGRLHKRMLARAGQSDDSTAGSGVSSGAGSV